MKIRKATKKDLNEIANLYLKLDKSMDKISKYIEYDFLASSKKTHNKEAIKNMLRGYLKNPKKYILLIAEENNILVGFVQATLDYSYTINMKKAITIDDIYVAKMRKGIGRAFLKEIEKMARKRKVKFILWEIFWKNNRARKFLKKNKFLNFMEKYIKELK